MTDWAKILISALAGVAVGVVLEPLKQRVMRGFTARKARNAIYYELGGIYKGFYLTRDEPNDYYFRCFKYGVLDDGAFWYYRNHNRDAFYALNEWEAIEDTYSAFRVIREQVLEGTKSAILGVADFRVELERNLRRGLDGPRLLAVAQQIPVRHDLLFLDSKKARQ